MRRATTAVLLLALFAPLFPVATSAEEASSTLPLSESVSTISTTTSESVALHVEATSTPEAHIEKSEPAAVDTFALTTNTLELEDDEQVLINQDDASQNIVFGGAAGGYHGHYLAPAPKYTALASGPVSKVRMYLSRNSKSGGDNRFQVMLFDESGSTYVCTLMFGAQAVISAQQNVNFNRIPVGSASDVALIEFDRPEGNCTLEAGTTYSFHMYYAVSVDPRYDEGIIYTKGADSETTFFLQVIGSIPPPPPVPTPPPSVAGTILAKSSDEAWDENKWTIDVAYNFSFAQNILVDGVITHIAVPMRLLYEASNAEVWFTLADGYSNLYDCKTPTKTLDEWGIPDDYRGTGVGPEVVTIGPFTGTECDTAARQQPQHAGQMGLRAFVTEPGIYQNFGGNLAIPGLIGSDGAPQFPYIVYSASTTPPVCTENCNSSVLFLPGLLGSRLYTDQGTPNRKLWEPNGSDDIRDLALKPDGSSKLPVYVGDVIDRIRPDGLPQLNSIYGELMVWLDILKSEEKIVDWRGYSYDWRYDVFDVVDDGSLKKDGRRDYLIPLVEQLAASSTTSKVTIIGHSNGGLLAKALMLRLQAQGKENLVDRIIFIGSPQTGTPQGVLGLLHGKDSLPPFIAFDGTVRSSVVTMPGVYALAPSSAYFSSPSPAIATFDSGTATNPYISVLGPQVDSFAEIRSFMTNIPFTHVAPKPLDEETPLPLPQSMLSATDATHALLDAWTPPAGIEVHEIAGWGNDTTTDVRYYSETSFQCTNTFSCGVVSSIDYEPITSKDGDDTVLTKSALFQNRGVHFNLVTLRKDFSEERKHDNIAGSRFVHQYIENLMGLPVTFEPSLYSSNLPSRNSDSDLIVGVHSPVILTLTDSRGRKTGIERLPGSDLFYIREEIPGSSVRFGGEGKYVAVPQGGRYDIAVSSIGTGTFDLTIDKSDGTIVKEFTALPVTPTTIATTAITGISVGTLALDTNNDGKPEVKVATQLNRKDALLICKQEVGLVRTVLVKFALLVIFGDLERYAGDNAKFLTFLKSLRAYVLDKSKAIPEERRAAIATCIYALENSKK